MRLLMDRKRSKLTWLLLIVALPILLTACGSGVSEEDLEAVEGELQVAQARVQSLETQSQAEQAQVQSLETQLQTEQAQVESLETELQTEQAQVESFETKLKTEQSEVAALQQRLDRAVAIQEVLDTFSTEFEGAPSAEAILEFGALIQASDDPVLRAKWVEIVEATLASAEPPPQETLNQAAAVVRTSGNVQVVVKFQEFLEAAARGEGGAAFLELAALVQASGDPALEALLVEIVNATFLKGEPPAELFEEFFELINAPGNEEIRQAFFALGGPPPEFNEEVGAKIKALGDPSLEALFEAAVESEGAGFEAFFQGLTAALRETIAR